MVPAIKDMLRLPLLDSNNFNYLPNLGPTDQGKCFTCNPTLDDLVRGYTEGCRSSERYKTTGQPYVIQSATSQVGSTGVKLLSPVLLSIATVAGVLLRNVGERSRIRLQIQLQGYNYVSEYYKRSKLFIYVK
jgi:hypothetical protein